MNRNIKIAATMYSLDIDCLRNISANTLHKGDDDDDDNNNNNNNNNVRYGGALGRHKDVWGSGGTVVILTSSLTLGQH